MTGRPFVSVVCATYNHESTITQAIESFLMQQTSFPIEIIVGEDCSTDRTRELCLALQKRHPDIVRMILQKENVGAMRNHLSAIQAAMGIYIANCEGDDYWTDPYKLQKQVDYMERHPDCSLCFHAVRIVERHQKTGKIIRASNHGKIFSKTKLFGFGTDAPSPSLFFRRRDVKNLPDWVRHAPVGDIPLRLLLSQYGTVDYINEVMAVRRIGTPGSWSRRMHHQAARRLLFPEMITMLDGFNTYTQYRYAMDVAEKQIEYELKSISSPFLHFPSVLRLFTRGKYRSAISTFPIMRRLRFYASCCMLCVYQHVRP